MNCRDIPGLEKVELREIEYSWGGAFDHVEIHRAGSVFHALVLINRGVEQEAHIRKAVFKIKLEGEKKPRTVTIKAGNKSGYNRGEEAMMIEDWLRARGFVLTEERPRMRKLTRLWQALERDSGALRRTCAYWQHPLRRGLSSDPAAPSG